MASEASRDLSRCGITVRLDDTVAPALCCSSKLTAIDCTALVATAAG